MTYAIRNELLAELDAIRAQGLYKEERIITSPQAAEITLDDGAKVLNFCANNYLGLADHPELIAAAKAALDRWGFGMASVRFICGTNAAHHALEKRLAGFLGMDDAILYSSCFDANAGLFETILGAEDAFGDMDFKVAGTKEFVTAIQLDTKLDGIPADVLAGALTQARDARMHILDVMNEAIDAPDEMSPYAPRITTVKVPVDKIGEVIGPKGKMINQIQDDTGADISIEDDGTVFIGATDGPSAEAAREAINAIANPVDVSRIIRNAVEHCRVAKGVRAFDY